MRSFVSGLVYIISWRWASSDAVACIITSLKFFLLIYCCVCMHMHAKMVWGHWRTNCGKESIFSFKLWILEIELRLSDLVAAAFIQWAISLVPLYYFLLLSIFHFSGYIMLYDLFPSWWTCSLLLIFSIMSRSVMNIHMLSNISFFLRR